ncbi:hypothetical protein Tco_0361113 [Tanacetum coccineum]
MRKKMRNQVDLILRQNSKQIAKEIYLLLEEQEDVSNKVEYAIEAIKDICLKARKLIGAAPGKRKLLDPTLDRSLLPVKDGLLDVVTMCRRTSSKFGQKQVCVVYTMHVKKDVSDHARRLTVISKPGQDCFAFSVWILGLTATGLKTKEGVVLAVEKLITSPLLNQELGHAVILSALLLYIQENRGTLDLQQCLLDVVTVCRRTSSKFGQKQLGLTATGLKTKEGVVLAVEKLITSPLLNQELGHAVILSALFLYIQENSGTPD